MSDTSITLRSHLLGTLNDLVDSANLGSLGKCSIVSELVSLFADYKEEGFSLFLDVYLTNDIEKLLKIVPNSSYLKLGNTTFDENGIREAVKKAAPLVRGCWKMYLSLKRNKIDYGLFRDSGNPLNVPIDAVLIDSDYVNFLRITKLAQDVVRTMTHKGKSLTIHFTNSKADESDSNKLIQKLAQSICSNVNEEDPQSSITYISSLLSLALRGAHGSLVVVINQKTLPSFLKDCTKLTPPIDLYKIISETRKNAELIPQLQAIENLVCGMFCCDGIVVFNSAAKIVAYNAFIPLKATSSSGGARKRAYQALSNRIGHGLKSAFFQSQDGASDFKD